METYLIWLIAGFVLLIIESLALGLSTGVLLFAAAGALLFGVATDATGFAPP